MILEPPPFLSPPTQRKVLNPVKLKSGNEEWKGEKKLSQLPNPVEHRGENNFRYKHQYRKLYMIKKSRFQYPGLDE